VTLLRVVASAQTIQAAALIWLARALVQTRERLTRLEALEESRRRDNRG
jgi:hypothetical protein